MKFFLIIAVMLAAAAVEALPTNLKRSAEPVAEPHHKSNTYRPAGTSWCVRPGQGCEPLKVKRSEDLLEDSVAA
ncbi:hypothetical protein MAP00_008126 [Monascus purpureus]|nr:hypothetical protein MAP00_008126 [Monascus purpureus]